jgi:hypothetical protein
MSEKARVLLSVLDPRVERVEMEGVVEQGGGAEKRGWGRGGEARVGEGRRRGGGGWGGAYGRALRILE